MKAAPGLGAGRGSQRRVAVDRLVHSVALRPASAPGEDRNASVGCVRGRRTPGCARPPRRARIATLVPRGGETQLIDAAPGLRAGRGSQRRRCARPATPPWRLRPASAPGEDRNLDYSTAQFGAARTAAPGLRAGRGSQPYSCVVGLRAHQLRPASAPGEDRNLDYSTAQFGAARTAAPGLRAGRGSQPYSCVVGLRAHQLRPASAPGEDRNARCADQAGFRRDRCARPPRRARIATSALTSCQTVRGPLRPASALGEDGNGPGLDVVLGAVDPLRPASAPGEDRNLRMSSGPVWTRCCTRPPRRARIATYSTCSWTRKVWSCAWPPRRARIATPWLSRRPRRGSAGCARPSRRARITTWCLLGGVAGSEELRPRRRRLTTSDQSAGTSAPS